MPILDRLRNAWNVFRKNEDSYDEYGTGSTVYSSASPSQPRRVYANERTIISSIYNRIAIDVSDVVFKHIKLDDQDRYADDVDSPLNDCLTFEPNMDQGPRAFRQDIVMTLFDRGAAALVPVDTTVEPKSMDIIDIYTLRVGEITGWHPKHVRVSVYNETKGIREEVTIRKRNLAIVENPLYSVMNSPNSTLQRLIRKLSLLDAVDEQSASGKLDLIIQLPYVIKTEARRAQAEQRREQIEFQLKDSKYGIAYTDGTEKITQLNRPAENNLMGQIEYLTKMLYGQLGITEEVMNGTADEKTMINYYNRTIEPICDAIKEAMQRSFIGPVKTKKKEHILFFRNPFKFVTVGDLAEITDKFTRNEVFSSNEIRGFMGVKPSKDPKADQLNNSNMPNKNPDAMGVSMADMDSVMDEVFNGLSADLDKMVNSG